MTILIIICIVTTFIAIISIILLFFYKTQINFLTKQLDFICNNPTNSSLTSTLLLKETDLLASKINMLIEHHKSERLLRENSEMEFRKALTGISHDLRTPLTSALGYVQILNDLAIEDNKRIEYLNIIFGRMITVRNMLDELYEYTRIESNEYTINIVPVNICNIARDIFSLYYDDIMAAGIVPTIEVPEIIMAKCDEYATKRILQNLINNAIFHGSDNLKFKISNNSTEEKVSISISNNAYMEADHVKHLFDRFYVANTSRNKSGSGLGLFVVKNLITRQNGSVSAQYENNELTMQLILPMAKITD